MCGRGRAYFPCIFFFYVHKKRFVDVAHVAKVALFFLFFFRLYPRRLAVYGLLIIMFSDGNWGSKFLSSVGFLFEGRAFGGHLGTYLLKY